MMFFNALTLFGGLAMFLYGMRLMGDGLKASSSGTLKKIMDNVTNSPIKAFLLGVVVTAIIQSSTATIVITSGLVGAGIISLKQSLGIIVGANVGTTVTGQIIRLLDIDSSGTSWLQIFKPSTLAPIALIAGIILIMGVKYKNSKTVGNILIGFGILFSGLLNMTNAVSVLSDSGLLEGFFSRLTGNPFIGYVTGAAVAFVLQSSSATIGILQAFSASGQLIFRAVYSVIVGVYLGDCVTTAIVCSIGAKAEARRVGAVNILFNLGKSILVLVTVAILGKLGMLDFIWDKTVNAGIIANANTIFNLACAVVLFPMLPLLEKLARKIIPEEPAPENKYAEKLEGLSPTFFNTPALALQGAFDVLKTMYDSSVASIEDAFTLLHNYDEKKAQEIAEEEENIDLLTDRVSNYLVSLSSHVRNEKQGRMINYYYKMASEFEHLSDQSVNISEIAGGLYQNDRSFSELALEELRVLEDLTRRVIELAGRAFIKEDADSASSIEPLEEVVDDVVSTLRDNHLERLRSGNCSVETDPDFQNLLSNFEHLSDTCSNIGVATVALVYPELANRVHGYVSSLHAGDDDRFNREYEEAHREFFERLEGADEDVDDDDE